MTTKEKRNKEKKLDMTYSKNGNGFKFSYRSGDPKKVKHMEKISNKLQKLINSL